MKWLLEEFLQVWKWRLSWWGSFGTMVELSESFDAWQNFYTASIQLLLVFEPLVGA
jgi:hypothetical protein